MLRGSRSWVHRQHTGPGRALCAQNGKESEHGRTLRYLCPRPALAAPPVAPAVIMAVMRDGLVATTITRRATVSLDYPLRLF